MSSLANYGSNNGYITSIAPSTSAINGSIYNGMPSSFDHRRNVDIISTATLPPILMDNNSVLHQQLRYPPTNY